jgi:hypothetical protein
MSCAITVSDEGGLPDCDAETPHTDRTIAVPQMIDRVLIACPSTKGFYIIRIVSDDASVRS